MKIQNSKVAWFLAMLVLLGSGSPMQAESGNPNVVVWGQNHVDPIHSSITNAIQVAVSSGYVLTLLSDGTMINGAGYFIGENTVKISGGYRFALLNTDGTVQADEPQSKNLKNVIDVSAGFNHYLALHSDGTVSSWGSNLGGQTNVPAGLSNVVAISAGGLYSLALRNDGTVIGWGSGLGGQTNLPSNLSNIVAVSAGGHHNLALTSQGRIVAWGNNDSGQISDLATLSNVVEVSAGVAHSLILFNNGKVAVRGSGSITNVPLDLPFVQSLNSGLSYSNMCGVVVNPDIAVHPPVLLSVIPQSQTQKVGSTMYVTAYVAGVRPITYQWYFGSDILYGATNSVLALSDLHLAQSGSYTVVASNSAGSVTSAPVVVNVVFSLDLFMTPTVVIQGEIGSTVHIEYIEAMGNTNWTSLGSVQVTNNPQLYFDTSAVGHATRFYRAVVK